MTGKNRTFMALLFGALMVFTLGCSPAARIKKSELMDLKDSPAVTSVHYTASLFMLALPQSSVRTGIGLSFGSFGRGAGAGISIGGGRGARPAPEIAAQFALEDPALRVRDEFASRLENEFGFKNIQAEEDALAEDDVRAVTERFGPGAVMDFRTTYWGLSSYSGKNLYYYTPYKVRARIIGPEGKIIWQGRCSYKAEKGPFSPTFDEAIARDAARLKKMLTKAADHCADELFGKLKDFRE